MNDMAVLNSECQACRKCSIGGHEIDGRLSNVFSDMNINAKLMVVGQNPGQEEVAAGIPFVGDSGKFFWEAVRDVLEMERSDFYVSNVVRCLTPSNRTPLQQELDNCRDFLDREIAILKPKLVSSLGSPAFKQLTGMSGINKHHGSPKFSIRYGIHVFPMKHPSPHNTGLDEGKTEFYADLNKLKSFLNEMEDGNDDSIQGN